MNKIHGILRLGLAAAGLFGAAHTAGAQTTLVSLPGPALAAKVVGEARPVLGWVDLCARLPRECEVDTTEPAVITLTAKTWQAIVSMNRRVNTTIRPLTDQAHWGKPDSWDLPTDGAGDCEDYQLLKRKLLAEAGLPRRAMRMTVVIDEKREGHAVLMVRTDRGDFILDNKTSAVLPWHETGYIYVKREGHDGPTWVSLGGATSPLSTANW
jgi:predicted transglutaminase-like cysteine proteinase